MWLNRTGMMAHYKTEAWLNRTGQVAQSPQDYSIFGTTRCPNITGNIVAIYKKFLPYLPERHGGFYRSSDERKSERVTVRLLYAIGLIVIDHYFPINMKRRMDCNLFPCAFLLLF